MKLEDLRPARGATRTRKRVGRGPGSGRGGTSTRGHKGEGARAGNHSYEGFEGGQMPLQRRVPKRGFKNIHAKPVETVNVGDLARLTGEIVTAELLREHGLIRDASARLKILGNGELKSPMTVRAHRVSEGARQKIEAAGGTVEIIAVPKAPKRLKKKSERRK